MAEHLKEIQELVVVLQHTICLKDKLVEKDFDIEAKAPGVLNPLIVPYNANVTNNILEIRFYWTGKGTKAIPVGGIYGLLFLLFLWNPSSNPVIGRERRRLCQLVLLLLL